MGHIKRSVFKCAKCADSDPAHAHLKYHPGLCSPFIHSDAHADLNLRCLHMPEDKVLPAVANIIFKLYRISQEDFIHLTNFPSF